MASIRNFAVPALFLVCCAALAHAPAHAEGLAKGSSLLSVQFTTGVADLATPEVAAPAANPGSITAYDHSEWGGQLQFQHLLSEDWALAIAFGLGTFKETDKHGTNALPGAEDFVYSQSSTKVRIGADRFVHLTPSFHLFVGPGVEYWKGHAKFESGTNSVESQDATRWAFNGRMGAHIALGKTVGLEGHLGHYFGTASAKDTGAEVKWSPSGIESAVGFAFKF